MKKKATIVSVIIGILAVAAIIVFSAYRSSESYRKAKAAIQWDCSVTCTEESTSAKYVITYSDVKVLSKTGTLTIQNKNDFDIVVHLLCEGEQEVVSDIFRRTVFILLRMLRIKNIRWVFMRMLV